MAQSRAEKVKLLCGSWLEQAKASGLVVPPGPRRARSQVECGVSIDYLAQLIESIRANPLLPPSTQLVVQNLINAATAEHKCRFLDVIPQEHVGYATAVVSHAWHGDFLDMLVTVVNEFSGRWEAHCAYRSQRKTAAQIMAEEKEAADAAAEAKRLQDEIDAVATAASARGAAHWTQDRESQSLIRQNTHSHQTSNSGAEPRNTHRSAHSRSNATEEPTPLIARMQRVGVDAAAVSSQLALAESPREAHEQVEESAWPHEPKRWGHQDRAIACAAGDKAAGMHPLFKLEKVVDAVTAQAAWNAELQNDSTASTPNLKKAATKILLHKRCMGAETGVSLLHNHMPHHSGPLAAAKPNVLARSGTLHCVGHRATEEDRLITQSIYSRAKANGADLTRLLNPVDEEQDIVDAYVKAQAAAVDKQAAARTAREQETLRGEKRKLLGYYVWIDIFALEQFAGTLSVDLAAMSRLINVVRRTIVIVDDEWRVLRRLWCLYEIWCTIKFKATLVTLTTASSQQTLHLSTGRLRTASSVAPWSAVGNAAEATRAHSPTSSGTPSLSRMRSCDDPSLALDPEPHLLSTDDLPFELPPVPAIDLLEAKATYDEDKVAILSVWSEEVASPRTQIYSLRQVTSIIRTALSSSRELEAQHASLIQGVYSSLALCGKNWRGLLASGWHELDAAREALKGVAEEFLSNEYSKARDLQAVSDGDVELELWQLIRFVAKHLAARHEEPFWIAEFTRFAALAHKSFATRFSSSYVDGLLRAAGTVDDMKVLRSYVHGCCHTRIKSKRSDIGD